MLVDYSSSESESDTPQEKVPSPPSPPLKKTSLSALLPKPKGPRKLADSSGDATTPKKIIVNLPKLSADDEGTDAPPTKKARVGGGGSGLSSILPAPRRSGAAVGSITKPLPPVRSTEDRADGERNGADKGPTIGSRAGGSSTMFVPQSVTKRPIQPASAFKKSTGGVANTQVKPKVSLFGSGTSPSQLRKPSDKEGHIREYKPIMLPVARSADRPELSYPMGGEENPYDGVRDMSEAGLAGSAVASASHQIQIGHGDGSEDLDTIARQAGLDDAAMRQLYGRRGKRDGPINISTFSVDEEYNNNELQRSLGLTEEVKPVRSIAPGKHQLSSLLNAARAQKGALEESFAQGRRNKREAGSKYGW